MQYYAALDDKPGLARFLLESGADIKLKNRRGNTPFYVAMEKGNYRTADVLSEFPNFYDDSIQQLKERLLSLHGTGVLRAPGADYSATESRQKVLEVFAPYEQIAKGS